MTLPAPLPPRVRIPGFAALAVLGAVFLAGCAASAPPGGAQLPSRSEGPYAVVLGSAQDGGLPQIGCLEAACVAARNDPTKRRLVASLLLVDPRTGGRWLIDATPDLREQLELARPHPASRREEGPRPPLFDGILLTHAHMGHYAGLIHLGREAYGASRVPIYASPRMCAFLRENGPWSLLVETGVLELRPIELGERLQLSPDISIEALPVPHRDELSDTLAFLVRGPRRTLLYLPDIDKWERWERAVEEVLATVDLALVDGTFFADGEVPGRSLAEIPHPFIEESLRRFARLPRAETAKVIFTHLNHTNPATDPDGAAAARIRAAGMHVAREGSVLDL